jgi:hypothetical protein
MFTQGQAIEFIQKVFGTTKLTNNGLNANVICPICDENKEVATKRKLAIRTDNFITHCWVCGYKSRSIYSLIKRYHPDFLAEYDSVFGIRDNKGGRCIVVYDESDLLPKEEALKLPQGFTLLATSFHDEDTEWFLRYAKTYLLDRGLTYQDFWFFKFGITTDDPAYKGRVIIPSFDAEGNLNYFTSRAISRRLKPKYFNPKLDRETIIFNEIHIDWSSELTLVEGPFDLVKCNENATCVLGSELTLKYKLFQRIIENNTPVLLAFDDDAVRKTLRTAKLLTEYGITVRLYSLPDNTHDVGEMTKEEFISLIPNAKLFSMEDSLRHRIASI